MAYVTAAEIVTRIGTSRAAQLTTESGSTPNSDLIDQFIAGVEGKVQQALNAVTSQTITQADFPQTWAMVRSHVFAMTIFELQTLRPPVAEDLRRMYDQAVEWLGKLAAGDVALPDVAANAPDPEHGFVRDDAGAEYMI